MTTAGALTGMTDASRRKRLLLIVEDDTALYDELSALFTEDGYRVIGASNGEQALAMLQQLQPDLILLDLMLPIITGWEVLAVLQTSPSLSRTPLIVMTAYADNAPSDVNHVMRKPFKTQELRATVQRLLREAG